MIPLLIETSLRLLLIAGGVHLGLTLTHARTGAVRHRAWLVVLAAILTAPVWMTWRVSLPVEVPHLVSFDKPRESVLVAPPEIRSDSGTGRPTSSIGNPVVVNQSFTAAPASSAPRASASTIVTLVWLAGSLLLISRAARGWRASRRLAAGATGIHADALPAFVTARVAQSPMVVSPVVAGLLRPRILLPMDWTTWPSTHLQDALRHEQAHVDRGDTRVAALSTLACCLAWFHPLAWWLDATLARCAEQACDDAVLSHTEERQSYAALLVAMAAAVRTNGHRVDWRTVGINGHGQLEARIDRILDGRCQRLSRTRLAALGLMVIASVGAGLACQQQPAPLAPDADAALRRQQREDRLVAIRSAEEMSATAVAALEATTLSAPEDIDRLERLLAFYQASGQKTFGWEEMIRRRRPHLLRLFDLYPESTVAFRTLVRAHDATGYDAARATWLRHLSHDDVSPAVLANAAEFFRASDKAMSEQILLRARTATPDGPQPRINGNIYSPPWTARLGMLYAQAIVGANDSTTFNVVRSFSPEEAAGPFAIHARRVMDSSTDPDLLVATGQYLLTNARTVVSLPFDVHALGLSYVTRAATLAPQHRTAGILLAREAHTQRHARVFALVERARTSNNDVVAALSPLERFELLADSADLTYVRAEDIEGRDRRQQAATLANARRYADDALRLAPQFASHPDYGTVLYKVHLTLGALALREGRRSEAVAHLHAAAATPGSKELAELPLATPRLVNYLLRAGERASVAEFYDRLAEINQVDRDRWLADARAVRAGRMTTSYQAMFGQGS